MNDRFRALARRLEAKLDSGVRIGLAQDPLAVIRSVGVVVHPLPSRALAQDCTCDGAFFPLPPPAIAYAATPGSRRENFTLLHEFGHYLVREDDDMLSELADVDDDGGQTAEERVCDAFAGRVLVPGDRVDLVLGGRRPEARDLPELFRQSIGSREACAVRLAERVGCFGYVALLDPRKHEVRFASASETCPYIWRRGSRLPPSHPVWRAAGGEGMYRGEGEVVWATGRRNLWLDAVVEGSVVVAVFSEDRYWPADGLGILGPTSVTSSRGIALSGTCRHCGADTWGYRACDKCGDVRCRSCGKCGCGAKESDERICPKCFLVKNRAQFPAGRQVCLECQP